MSDFVPVLRKDLELFLLQRGGKLRKREGTMAAESLVFTSFRVQGLTLKNRTTMAPLYLGYANPDGLRWFNILTGHCAPEGRGDLVFAEIASSLCSSQ